MKEYKCISYVSLSISQSYGDITAMYGYFGPILDRLANICFFLPVYAAYVGHNELGANENVPIIIGSLYFLVLVLPRGSSSSTTEQIKKD